VVENDPAILVMKKSFVAILAVCSMAVFATAQGTFIIDSSINGGSNPGPGAVTGGLVYIFSDFNPADGILDKTQDINLGVLWGFSAGSATTPLNIDPLGLNTGIYAGTGNWIASQATGQFDITGYGSGALFDINGNNYAVPGAAAGTTIFLVLQGWTGNSPTYNGVTLTGPNAGAGGQTIPFAITLAVNNSLVQPDVHGMSSLVIGDIPEPSMLTLSSLGVVLTLVRRKK